MAILQRLSTVPTIPDLMQSEWNAWIDNIAPRGRVADWQSCVRRGQVLVYLTSASAVLAVTHALLTFWLVRPDFAAKAFPIAVALCRKGVRTSRLYR